MLLGSYLKNDLENGITDEADAPDVADSFYAVDRLVFKEKKLTLTDLVSILKNNWDDNEKLRLYVKKQLYILQQ